jgi:hypothetical protein
MSQQPLSQRLSGAKPDGPYEGVPDHIEGGVELWFEHICGYRSNRGYAEGNMQRLAAHIRSSIGSRYSRDHLMRAILREGANNQVLFLDIIDGALHIWGENANRWEFLNEVLSSGASAWRVADDRMSLTQVVSDETKATYEAAISVADEPAQELKEAWSNAFGRNGDPSDAWDHAIKALEDILIPVVVPNQTKPNLGHVLGQLRNQGGAWEMVLPGASQTNDVAPLVAMLELVWPNHDRHGGTGPRRTPSEQEGRGVVTLAATIVQWHREGWVVQRR